MNSVQKRRLVIDTVTSLVKETNDRALIKGVDQLCIQFFPTGVKFQETLDGMVGLIHWCEDNPEHKKELATTLIHDLSEFVCHRTENWYCPRSLDYAKYIKEKKSWTKEEVIELLDLFDTSHGECTEDEFNKWVESNL